MNRRRLAAAACLGLVLTVALAGRYLTDLDPLTSAARPWTKPNREFPFGTDGLGRDVLARVLWGGRDLTVVAALAAAVASAAGVLVGLWNGWHSHDARTHTAPRGRLRALTAASDLMLAVPAVLVALVLAVAAPAPIAVIAATVIAGAPLTARVVADVSADARHATYVDVARMRGDSTASILVREILPSHLGIVTTDYGLRVVVALQLLATINALGLDTAPPEGDWAAMITDNFGGVALNPVATIAPAAALAVLATTIALASTSWGSAPTRRGSSL